MKLTKILESVLDELNVPKPEDAYPFDSITKNDYDYGRMYKYIYTNKKGIEMEISNLVSKPTMNKGKSIYIAFKRKGDVPAGEEEEYDEKKYKEKTKTGDMLKVLATVVKATKDTIEKEGLENIESIKFSPADKKRNRIYMYYIKTLFPDFKEAGKDGIFTTFVNKDYKKTEPKE